MARDSVTLPHADGCACARCEFLAARAASEKLQQDWRGEFLIRGCRAGVEVRNRAQGFISNLVRRAERERPAGMEWRADRQRHGGAA